MVNDSIVVAVEDAFVANLLTKDHAHNSLASTFKPVWPDDKPDPANSGSRSRTRKS